MDEHSLEFQRGLREYKRIHKMGYMDALEDIVEFLSAEPDCEGAVAYVKMFERIAGEEL